MKYLLAAIVLAGSLASIGPANAAGGCGPGFHRGVYGRCVPNRGPVIVRPRVCPRGFIWRGGRCRPF